MLPQSAADGRVYVGSVAHFWHVVQEIERKLLSLPNKARLPRVVLVTQEVWGGAAAFMYVPGSARTLGGKSLFRFRPAIGKLFYFFHVELSHLHPSRTQLGANSPVAHPYSQASHLNRASLITPRPLLGQNRNLTCCISAASPPHPTTALSLHTPTKPRSLPPRHG